MQTTAIDAATGQIRLTTLLAHASGEWISSDWPVCSVSETAAPHRMGAALTYARRYALFALVGIAGEDDLDAPDTIEPSPSTTPERRLDLQLPRKSSNGTVHKPPKPALLAPTELKQLREQLLAEIGTLEDGDGLALWAYRRLAAKNTLIAEDAQVVEAAYQALLETGATVSDQTLAPISDEQTASGLIIEASAPLTATETTFTPAPRSVRRRSKAHLVFVRAQPCLICERGPCDAHHLKFAQPRGLSLKVSDEFTVPLCRSHHRELHRHGDEVAWWEKMRLKPIPTARQLWQTGPVHASSSSSAALTVAPQTTDGFGKT